MSRLVWDVGRADPRGSYVCPPDGLGRGRAVVAWSSGLFSPGANPDAGSPFGSFLGILTDPGFKLEFKKNTPEIQKFNLKCKSGDFELKLKFH